MDSFFPDEILCKILSYCLTKEGWKFSKTMSKPCRRLWYHAVFIQIKEMDMSEDFSFLLDLAVTYNEQCGILKSLQC